MELSWKLKMRLKFVAVGIGLTAMVWAQAPVQFNQVPSRSVGQAKLQLVSTAPNLVEGRELNGPIGLALDTGVNPPILYVADTNNNRIMVWRNARAATGSKADYVIGQNDFFATQAAGPGTTNSIGLRSPTGLAVDRRGNVYVLDTGNNRILRYGRVTEQSGDLIQPNMVIGQTSFSARESNQGNSVPSAKSIALTVGATLYSAALTIDSAGNLWLTDAGNNRVVRYPASALGDSSPNGPEADLVLGQLGMTTVQTVEPELCTRLTHGLERCGAQATWNP
jgi:sugar lactone lactonase YvrE